MRMGTNGVTKAEREIDGGKAREKKSETVIRNRMAGREYISEGRRELPLF